MAGRSLRVELSPAARRDLRAILRTSREGWGERQRDAYQAAIDQALVRLASFPERGRTRDDLAVGHRSIPVEHHLIFYRVEGDFVRVNRILHSLRDLEAVALG